MREIDLNKLMSNSILLNGKIEQYTKENTIRQEVCDAGEIQGHIAKAKHNLEFVKENLKLGFTDWCITGCYYAMYHAALALILTKGYASKNHDATLCLLIRDYYRSGIDEEEIILINRFFLSYQDILFYVESKQKREEASYSSKIKFDKQTVEELRLKAILFVDKAKEIVGLA